jgi:hypothetical protein
LLLKNGLSNGPFRQSGNQLPPIIGGTANIVDGHRFIARRLARFFKKLRTQFLAF